MADKAPKGKKQVPSTASVNDATVRKKPPELKSNREYFQNLIDAVSDIILSIKLPERVIEWTNASIRSRGYEPEECIGRTTEFLYKERDDFLAFGKKIMDAVAKGETLIIAEYPFKRKDGEIFPAEYSNTILMEQGKPNRLICIIRDVTERKRAEEQILHLNRVLKSLRDINQLITLEKDKERLIQRACTLLVESRGYSLAWLLLLDEEKNFVATACAGVDFASLIGQLKQGAYPACIGKILTSREPAIILDAESESCKNCALSSAHRSGIFLLGRLESEGKVYGVMVVNVPAEISPNEEEQSLFQEMVSDISHALANIEKAEKLEKAEEKARKVEILREVDRLRSELMSNVSHELRTPLTSIKGFSSTLLQPDVKWKEEEQRDFIQSIDKEADRLTRLISDLLDISRIDANALKVDKRSCKVSEILDAARNRLAVLTKNHKLKIEVPPELPLVFVDEMRIGQVLTNLVENATKFSHGGTQITIGARVDADRVIMSVIDQGTGIAPEVLPKLFDRFYQAESIVRGRKKGTGLGLSICRGIMETHGEKIWVESKVGEGSIFSFSLPVSKEA